MSGPIISLRGLSKRFGEVRAVDRIDLDIQEGEFFALLGPSGCGKTTLLRLIAGFEAPSEGQVLIDGVDVAGQPPNRRPVNTVFQSYAVFPHMSVADNVAYGLKMEGVPADERGRRVEEALALVRLEGLGARRPDQLSGGQRQRVALARALVKRPRVLLLDEPLSALDAKLREQMRTELAQLQLEVGITFVLVTHDQEEALALAGRCAVMQNGHLEQLGSPRDLYERPASRAVADFIGEVNLFEGVLQASGSQLACADLPIPVRLHGAEPAPDGTRAWAAIRPERIALEPRGAAAPSKPDSLAGTRIAYLGGDSVLEVRLEAGRSVRVRRPSSTAASAMEAGTPIWLSWSADAPVLLTS